MTKKSASSKSKPAPQLGKRFLELKDRDLVEIKWIDASAHGGWYLPGVDTPVEVISLGYLSAIDSSPQYDEYISIYSSFTETGTRGNIQSIPLSCVREIRIISKGII